MTISACQYRFDAEDFLVWEETQAEKHEFLDGEVFAMVGSRREHVVVTLNFGAAFKQRLRGGPYQAYVSDLKLRVESADAFFYPDVMVSCDARDHTAEQYLSRPKLIVEVLSDSTEAFDRGEKFAAYRTLDSLQEYVVVDIPSRRVETFVRTPDDDWLLHEWLSADEECVFAALGVAIPFDEIFENCTTDVTGENSHGTAAD